MAWMNGTTDREKLESVAARAADARDKRLRLAEGLYEAAIKSAEETYKAAIARAEESRRRHRQDAFEIMEREQDAAQNFIDARNDRKRIECFGLGLPFLHDSNLFGRPARQALADRIAAKACLSPA